MQASSLHDSLRSQLLFQQLDGGRQVIVVFLTGVHAGIRLDDDIRRDAEGSRVAAVTDETTVGGEAVDVSDAQAGAVADWHVDLADALPKRACADHRSSPIVLEGGGEKLSRAGSAPLHQDDDPAVASQIVSTPGRLQWHIH